MSVVKSVVFFIARFMVSILFLIAGIGHILDWESAEHALTNSLYSMTEHSAHVGLVNDIIEKLIPIAPLLLMGSVALLIIGSLLVILGIKVRLGAFCLFIFLLPVTLIMHHFWLLQGPERMTEMIHFMKNISMLGGLLLLMLNPSVKKSDSFASNE